MVKQAADTAVPALELHGISKTFGATQALKEVDLRVAEGEILGLLGQNGSGKSTLVGILAGYHLPDRGGEVHVAGRPVSFPVSRAEHGLSFVFQDLGLAGGLTVLENLNMWKRSGGAPGRWRINWRAEIREAEATFHRYGVELPVTRKVARLSLLDQALIAIVRAAEELRRFREGERGGGQGILVLDEPTVFLPAREKAFLFTLIRRVVEDGSSVIFVSHDLAAIGEIAHRAAILRDGSLVGEMPIAEATEERLAKLILGYDAPVNPGTREAAASPAADGGAVSAAPGGLPAFRAWDLQGGRVSGAALAVSPGEIVGVAGLIGSGIEDLPYLLFGALHEASGEFELAGERGSIASLRPAASVRMGIALVPADRKRDGIAESSAIWENGQLLVLRGHQRYGILHRRRLLSGGARQVRDFDVRPASPQARAASLSGGNQQKVLLAKWLEIGPRLLILHEPTQGVDIGARAEIVELVRERTRKGMAVLWVTSDFEELANVCDRVLVMKHGTVVDDLRAADGEVLSAEVIDLAVLSSEDEGTAQGSAAAATGSTP